MQASKNRTRTGKDLAADSNQVRVLRVIDGDTVLVQQKGGFLKSHPQERIRLWGIDAPESKQKGGPESTKHLQRLIGNKDGIWLKRMTVDQYGRTVGIIHPRRDTTADAYNYRMVKDGQAHCYMLSGPEKARYDQAEQEAKNRGHGIWKKPKKTEHPRLFRQREKRQESRKTRIRVIILLALLTGAIAAAALTQYEFFTK